MPLPQTSLERGDRYAWIHDPPSNDSAADRHGTCGRGRECETGRPVVADCRHGSRTRRRQDASLERDLRNYIATYDLQLDTFVVHSY